jgi:hypothetical protein
MAMTSLRRQITAIICPFIVLSIIYPNACNVLSIFHIIVILFQYLSPTYVFSADSDGPHHIYVHMTKNIMYID